MRFKIDYEFTLLKADLLYTNVLSTIVQLPSSAERMVMSGSFLRDVTALLPCVVRLDADILVPAGLPIPTPEYFILLCQLMLKSG